MSTRQSKFTLCVVGRSGSGKGKQADRLLALLRGRAHHMETGRFLRDIIHTRINETTRRARRFMEQGRLMPLWFSSYTWLRELIERGKADTHLLFDGAPRRVHEAEILDDVLAWHERSLSLCIYIDVSRSTAAKRLRERGRHDDTPTAIKNRMDYFSKEVLPVISYYKKRHRLIHIDGEQPIENVCKDIVASLSRRLGPGWRRLT